MSEIGMYEFFGTSGMECTMPEEGFLTKEEVEFAQKRNDWNESFLKDNGYPPFMDLLVIVEAFAGKLNSERRMRWMKAPQSLIQLPIERAMQFRDYATRYAADHPSQVPSFESLKKSASEVPLDNKLFALHTLSIIDAYSVLFYEAKNPFTADHKDFVRRIRRGYRP